MSSQGQDRRHFLKRGAAGLAAMALCPQALRGQTGEEAKDPGGAAPPPAAATPAPAKERKFVRRTLGRTGIVLPVVSMGAQGEEAGLIRAALDAGIVHVDTANTYSRGRHEETLGQVLKGRPRDSFVIGTKVYMNMDQKTGLYPPETSPADFAERFEASLKRLGLDYVEILYLHDVVRRESALFEPLLSALRKQKEAGKARFLGLSVHRNEPEVIDAAVDSKLYDVVLTSYNFRQPHRAEVERAIARAAGAGLGVVAMKTMAGAFWDRERKEPINVRAALKWALANPNVHTAIPGFTSFEEMEADLSVMEDLALTPEERRDLRLGDEQKLSGLYCSQCGRCVAQCRQGLPLPDLMRGYMYAYGYRRPAAARALLDRLEMPSRPCADCVTCAVSDCAMGFDVGARVTDIARLREVPEEFLVA